MKATKQVYDKKTGERYPSKAVMMKHEKGESKSVQKNEESKFAAKKNSGKKKCREKLRLLQLKRKNNYIKNGYTNKHRY